jgi:hypothetical protein
MPTSLLRLRSLLFLALLLLGMVAAPVFAIEPPTPVVAVSMDGRVTVGMPASARLTFQASDSLEPWAKWAYLREGAAFNPDGFPEEGSVTGIASHGGRHIGLLLHNTGMGPCTVRLETYLPQGLWRVEAALIAVDETGEAVTSAKLWRMESILRPASGATPAKMLGIPPGHYLALRWTETGALAFDALKAARGAAQASGNIVMRKRVLSALEGVGDALETVPTLVGRGDREKIGRKIHSALLATGKAQALWQNWRELERGGGDAAFEELNLALSEVSCAAFNLVPHQNIVMDENGVATVKLTLTNAGKNTVPLVALGLAETKSADGLPPASTLSVFRNLKPGAQVGARFRVTDGALAKGIVQFVSRMGTAVVAACPVAP